MKFVTRRFDDDLDDNKPDSEIVLHSLNTMLEHCDRISCYGQQIDDISEDAIAFRLILMSVVTNRISDWLSKNSDYDWDRVKGFEDLYLSTNEDKSKMVRDMADNHVPGIRDEIEVLIGKVGLSA